MVTNNIEKYINGTSEPIDTNNTMRDTDGTNEPMDTNNTVKDAHGTNGAIAHSLLLFLTKQLNLFAPFSISVKLPNKKREMYGCRYVFLPASFQTKLINSYGLLNGNKWLVCREI